MESRLAPVRLVGYVRVSRVGGRQGDSFISPALQREQIEAFAKIRGFTIVDWIEDLDESGGKYQRPGFQRALEMVERGEVDGIAVSKLDRFARSVIDALHAIERIRAAGGELVSVTDNFDTTTAIGKAMLQITLVFAELERERQREGFRAAQVRAISRGIHISTHVSVGYRRGDDRRLVQDPRAARAIREVFLRRAAGDSYSQLAAFLDEALPREGRTWTRNTVEKLIRSRTYLGEAHQGDIVNVDAHEALVSRAEWEAAQPQPGVKRFRGGSLLAGIVTCGSCGSPLTRATSFDYGCRARRGNGVCAAPVMVRMAATDDHVASVFLEWAARQDVQIVGTDRDTALEAELARLEQAEAEYVAYRDSTLMTVVGEDNYRAGLEARGLLVDDAREAVVRSQNALVVPLAHFDAPSLWPDLDMRERRLLIESAIARVVVSGSTPGLSVVDRLRVVFRGDGEDEAGLAGA